MNTRIFTTELTWKGAFGVLIALAAAVGLLYAGRFVYRHVQSRPRAAKAEIFRFLKEKSGARSFEVAEAAFKPDMNALSNELAVLKVEFSATQSNIVALQQQLRTNRDEIATANQELRKARRAAGLPPRRNSPNNQPAVVTAGSSNQSSETLATNFPSADNVSATTNVVFDLAAAAETNQTFKLVLEKERALTARQDDQAKVQQQLRPLQKQAQGKQREVAMKERELMAVQDGTAAQTKIVRDFQLQIGQAASWDVLYKLMGQELYVAEQLLSGTNIVARQNGLRLVEQARVQAQQNAENSWLAARICEAYIWPNAEAANANNTSTAGQDDLLISAGITFRLAGETNNYVKNSEMLIRKTSNPVRADYVRSQLGFMYERMGNFEAALKHFRAIQTSNTLANVADHIPFLEEKLKAAKKK